MTSIIIAGRPNSEEMSECILVAENISNMYPSSRFTVVLKSPKEWEQYCEDLCNLFGILKKTHPLILFSNGKKIGGAQDFFKLISDSFKYDKLIKKNEEYIFDIDPSEVTKLTKENTLLVEKEYACRTSGIYIIDKINQRLEEIPDKKFIENYNKYNTIETDYDTDLIEDMKVYVKYDNKFTPSPKDYKEYTEIIEERPAYADKEKYNAYHEELRLKKELEEKLKKEAEEEAKRKQEEEERLKEEALKTEEEKNDTEGNNTNRKNKDKKKKEEEKKRKEEEKKKKEEEERKKKEEEELKKKEEEDKKKEEENTLKTETEAQQQNTESLKEEQVPEVKEIKYKRIFFKCYTDFDIPYEKFDKELIIENFNAFNFQLVINPYFTFFGETIINKIKDYEAPLLPEREEPVVEEDEIPQLTTISAGQEPNVTKDKSNQNKTTESAKDKKNVKNDPDKKEKDTPQNTVSGSNSFRKDEKKQQQNNNNNASNNNVNNNNANNNTQQNDNKNNNNAVPNPTENPQKNEIKFKGPTESTEPNTYKPNFTEEKRPKDVLVIKDFGRLPSLRMIQFGGEDLRFYQEYIPPYQLSEHIKNTTNLFNFGKDTNIIDDDTLYSLIEMVNETDGYVTYKVLPYNYTDWKKFGSNTFKILPNKSRDIKNEEYPLVDKINQQLIQFKRELFSKSVENIDKDDPKNVELILHNEDFDQCFPPPEFFSVDVYKKHGIPHLIKTFTSGTFISVNLKFAINKMCEKLEINNTTGYGFCLIICKKFVFITPLKEPYTYTKGGVNEKNEQVSPRIPIFAEPYYFMGIFTLPYIESEWPESIKRKNVKFDLLNILKKSTN